MLSTRTFFFRIHFFRPPIQLFICTEIPPRTICNPIWNVLLIYREDFPFFMPSTSPPGWPAYCCCGVKVNREWRVESDWNHLSARPVGWWFISQRGRNPSWAVGFSSSMISLISDLVALFNEWRLNDWARAGIGSESIRRRRSFVRPRPK